MIYFRKYYASKSSSMKYKSIYNLIIKIAFVFHIIELTSLLILTYVSSVEIFFIHMISFVLFLITSSIYMILTILTYFLPRDLTLTQNELSSRNLKLFIFLFYLGCFISSLYFYIRHNRFCEPYIYSYFSLFEYLTVLTNIAYHSMIIYDLKLNTNSFKICLLELKIE